MERFVRILQGGDVKAEVPINDGDRVVLRKVKQDVLEQIRDEEGGIAKDDEGNDRVERVGTVVSEFVVEILPAAKPEAE